MEEEAPRDVLQGSMYIQLHGMSVRGFVSNRPFLLALVPVAILSGVAVLFAYDQKRKREYVQAQVTKLQAALQASLAHREAERRGRIRAEQTFRKLLLDKDSLDANNPSYPMTPVGFIQSCFSTRNGTPRQPLMVPLARACLVLSSDGVPASALDGLMEYSHCWILYIFHANTDLPQLWKRPSHKDFKAKVRVPRLDGMKLGVYATRTPHRPCPIGLTVAKVEGVHGRMLMISGADLVDGTPVLDVKPYLPYCDCVLEAKAPSWVSADRVDDPLAMDSVHFSEKFMNTLLKCWEIVGGQSLYSNPNEFQELVKQVLCRDIRSLRQRKQPHSRTMHNHKYVDEDEMNHNYSFEDCKPTDNVHCMKEVPVLYKVVLEGLTVSYTVEDGRVKVQDVRILDLKSSLRKECSYITWRKVALTHARC